MASEPIRSQLSVSADDEGQLHSVSSTEEHDLSFTEALEAQVSEPETERVDTQITEPEPETLTLEQSDIETLDLSLETSDVPQTQEQPEIRDVSKEPEEKTQEPEEAILMWAELQQTPETEKVPETPDVQGVSHKPEVQGVPDKPQVEGSPDRPEVEEIPDKPEVQERTETPEAERISDKPEAVERVPDTVPVVGTSDQPDVMEIQPEVQERTETTVETPVRAVQDAIPTKVDAEVEFVEPSEKPEKEPVEITEYSRVISTEVEHKEKTEELVSESEVEETRAEPEELEPVPSPEEPERQAKEEEPVIQVDVTSIPPETERVMTELLEPEPETLVIDKYEVQEAEKEAPGPGAPDATPGQVVVTTTAGVVTTTEVPLGVVTADSQLESLKLEQQPDVISETGLVESGTRVDQLETQPRFGEEAPEVDLDTQRVEEILTVETSESVQTKPEEHEEPMEELVQEPQEEREMREISPEVAEKVATAMSEEVMADVLAETETVVENVEEKEPTTAEEPKAGKEPESMEEVPSPQAEHEELSPEGVEVAMIESEHLDMTPVTEVQEYTVKSEELETLSKMAAKEAQALEPEEEIIAKEVAEYRRDLVHMAENYASALPASVEKPEVQEHEVREQPEEVPEESVSVGPESVLVEEAQPAEVTRAHPPDVSAEPPADVSREQPPLAEASKPQPAQVSQSTCPFVSFQKSTWVGWLC